MMRRTLSTIVVAAAIVMLAGKASAQIGVVGGGVSADVTYSTGSVTGQKALIGFAAGLTLRKEFVKGFEFAPEVLYFMKGTALDVASGTQKLKIAYGELAVLFRVNLGPRDKVHGFVTAGPTAAVRVSCKTDVPGVGTADCNAGGTTEPYKSSDYGVMFGAGVSSGKIEASARYEAGLADINNLSNVASVTIKNKAIMVMVGITL